MDVTFFENQSYFSKFETQGESLREYQIWDLLQETQAIFPSTARKDSTQPPPLEDPNSATDSVSTKTVPAEPVPTIPATKTISTWHY